MGYDPNEARDHTGKWTKTVVPHTDIQVGDRLDISGKTRISKVLRRDGVTHVQTKTTGARSPSVAKFTDTATVYRPTYPSLGAGESKRLSAKVQIAGGFTYNVKTAEEPTSGFAVSIPGHEEKIPGHPTPAQIRSYVKKHDADLADPAAHLGAWYNTDDHTTYLDVTHVLKSKAAAEKTAVAHNQLAYFDLGDFTEHRVPGRADKEKTMSLSFITPNRAGEYDLSARDGKLAYWKQILPMKSIHYTAKDGTRQTIDFTKDYLEGLASATAVDQVGFLLADRDNAHTMDPERWRGEVAAMEVRVNGDPEADGLWGKIVFPSTEAAKAVLDNPALGVSARIRPNVERSDGSTVPAGIIHVLGTLDPQVSGMSPWIPTDLSTEQDEVLDLTQEEYEDMADKTQAEKFADITEADIDKMDEATLDEYLAFLGVDVADYTGDEPEGDEPTDETQTQTKDEPVLAGAGADMSNVDTRDIELANANSRATEALRRVAEAEWREERSSFMDQGVPAAALDLAAPVLNRADDMVIDLSFASEEDVNVSAIVRGLLDSLKGTVDLSTESGHFGVHSGDDNPDQAILDRWTVEG